MLPVRLGMLNARGPQDLVLYVLTASGRVEATNYRTVKMPANMDLPVFVRGEFARTYKALFAAQSAREDYRAIFTEYFWDMSWCDPCAAEPLTPAELRQAGVYWVGDDAARGGGQPVMLTRLHLRYTRDSLPEDLVFQETQDRANFQARYVLRHPWAGSAEACEAAGPTSTRCARATSARRRRWRRSPAGRSPTCARGWRCPRRRRRAGGSRCGNERAHASLAAWRDALALARARHPLLRDARLFQIVFLATLLTIGVLARDFALLPQQMALAFMAGLATQKLWLRALRLEQRGVLSAVITCFGLSILLRADSLWVHPLAAALAISAKFVLRVNGKHVYNPANLGVILAISLLPGAWVSPGQWGQDVALAGWFVVLGGRRRVARASLRRRVDVSRRYLGLVALRVLALGQPWTICAAPVRQRRAAALRVLHDLRSDDDPEPARGARGLRDARRDGGVRVALRAVPDQRARLGAVPLLAAGAADRSLVAGAEVRVERTGNPAAGEVSDRDCRRHERRSVGRSVFRFAHSSSCLRCLAYSAASCCCSGGGACS